MQGRGLDGQAMIDEAGAQMAEYGNRTGHGSEKTRPCGQQAPGAVA